LRQQHKSVLRELFFNADTLRQALGLDSIWMRGMEFQFDNLSPERADLVFQDKWDAYRVPEDVTCYVLELKSEVGDHEVVGQLKKAVTVMDVRGRSTGHWHRTVGIAVARKFTKTGLELLWQEKYRAFEYTGDEGDIKLTELEQPEDGSLRPVKKAVSKEWLEKMRAAKRKEDCSEAKALRRNEK